MAAQHPTRVVHPIDGLRRHGGMPTTEVLSLIVAVLLWIALLVPLAPDR
jgi:hypothetical protein